MDFQERLKRAIERGEKTRVEQAQVEAREQLSLGELKTLHSGYRLELADHIESCLKQLADQMPGFEFQSIVSEEGWGGRLSRDDLELKPGQSAATRYSRLEMTISPFTPTAIVELLTKGTVRNREIMNRTNYQKVDEFDMDSFKEMVDHRVIEFAEQFSSSSL
ncbi:hypothetical protein KOR42_15410 [Thalassoglobus neptunius]|uniref:Uncharacterized protein n=1 Tax=Thalassoglobus neptunius TaxID=1938619 RepID=A0A5C5X5G5_9PLAN|nr:hypothetical protein [Thalassoglobus neptunius]TWT58170.1 hypothetical protein KOR42_15410 [Thalassoglobus neptunius]